jgi:hypothetical protein
LQYPSFGADVPAIKNDGEDNNQETRAKYHGEENRVTASFSFI